jgi:hypothetical protein
MHDENISDAGNTEKYFLENTEFKVLKMAALSTCTLLHNGSLSERNCPVVINMAYNSWPFIPCSFECKQLFHIPKTSWS